jgi:hypothetical protein
MRLPLPKSVTVTKPKPVTKKRKSNVTTVATDKDGWIDTKSTKRKRKLAASVSDSSKSAKGTRTSTKKKTTKKKTETTSKRARPSNTTKSRPKKLVKTTENEVIELSEDSDESDCVNLELVTHTKTARPRRVSAAYVSLRAARSTDRNDILDDESSFCEYEFE